MSKHYHTAIARLTADANNPEEFFSSIIYQRIADAITLLHADLLYEIDDEELNKLLHASKIALKATDLILTELNLKD